MPPYPNFQLQIIQNSKSEIKNPQTSVPLFPDMFLNRRSLQLCFRRSNRVSTNPPKPKPSKEPVEGSGMAIKLRVVVVPPFALPTTTLKSPFAVKEALGFEAIPDVVILKRLVTSVPTVELKPDTLAACANT